MRTVCAAGLRAEYNLALDGFAEIFQRTRETNTAILIDDEYGFNIKVDEAARDETVRG